MGKEPLYPLSRRLVGPQCQSGSSGGKKYIPAHAGNSTPDCPAHSVVNILTVLPWHSLMGSKKNHEQLSQDGQYPSKDMDMASLEHKPEASPLHPIYSVHLRQHTKCHISEETN